MGHCEPVSVGYRTGLRHAETEIGKLRAETGARNPPVLDRKSGNFGTEIRPRQPNPPECRRFSHIRKSHRRDRTGWLGSKDSKSQMTALNTPFEISNEFCAFFGTPRDQRLFPHELRNFDIPLRAALPAQQGGFELVLASEIWTVGRNPVTRPSPPVQPEQGEDWHERTVYAA
jgi:hypothetical protein